MRLEERAALEPAAHPSVVQFLSGCSRRHKLQQLLEVTPSRPVPLRVQAEECEPLQFEPERYELQPVMSSPEQGRSGRWTEQEEVGETPRRRDEMRSLAASTSSDGGEKEEDPDEEHRQTDEGQALGTQRLGHCGPERLNIENGDAGAVLEPGELNPWTVAMCPQTVVSHPVQKMVTFSVQE